MEPKIAARWRFLILSMLIVQFSGKKGVGSNPNERILGKKLWVRIPMWQLRFDPP